eukprot:IDg11336t1
MVDNDSFDRAVIAFDEELTNFERVSCAKKPAWLFSQGGCIAQPRECEACVRRTQRTGRVSYECRERRRCFPRIETLLSCLTAFMRG